MNKIRELIHFVSVGIWHITGNQGKKQGWNLLSILKIIILSVKLCLKQKINVQASALTYYTFFAIVPTLAFVIAICRGFGYDRFVADYIADALSGSTYLGTVQLLFSMVESYLDHAKGGVFIGIGIIFLLWSIYNVFSQIEKSINEIWGVSKLSPIVRRCTYYFTITLIIPFLIIISSGLTYYINHNISLIGESWLLNFIIALKPWVVSWFICTLVYMLIPNTNVHLASAIPAGILAGSAVLIFKSMFFFFMKLATSYNAVYGSLAAIPILMLFLRILWMIILCGAEISYARQKFEMYEFEEETNDISPRYFLCVELYVVKLIAKQLENGLPYLTFQEITSRYSIPPRLLSLIIEHLCRCDVLQEHEDTARNKTVYVTTKDINQLTVGNVLSRLHENGKEDFLSEDNRDLKEIWAIVKQIDNSIYEGYKDHLIKSL